MKHRTLLSNICSVIIIVALVFLLLAYSGVFGGGRDSDVAKLIIRIALPVAIVAVALFDIILPLIDNRKMLKEPKYVIKAVVKIILFAAAMVLATLTLFSKLPAGFNEMLALGIFVVLYFAQFFINLDPKTVKKKAVEAEEKPAPVREVKKEKEDTSETEKKEE